MQSRIDSFMESVTNALIGIGVGFVANLFILPFMLGVTLTLTTNMGISIFYTVVSIVRSYLLRRAFNGRSVWQAVKAFCAANESSW